MKKSGLKQGDVFHASWKEWEGQDKNWCFEGLLVVMVDDRGEKWLVDTYWGINRWDNKKWKYSEAMKHFKLKFYVNLNEVERIEKYKLDEYNDEDLFRLHDQHSCSESCNYWFVKKGAKKSPTKKMGALNELIREAKSDIEYKIRSIENMSAEVERIKINGL